MTDPTLSSPRYHNVAPIIGVATSVFPDRQYDALDTVMWAAENHFPVIQLYLSTEFLTNKHRQMLIFQALRRHQQSVIFHAPDHVIARSDQRSYILDFLCQLPREILYNTCPILVWHINPEFSKEIHASFQREMLARGIVSAPENILPGPHPNHAGWCNDLCRILWKEPGVIPVLDLPRFYTMDRSPEDFVEDCITAVPRYTSVILHCIDCLTNPEDRSQWTALGSGNLPWSRWIPAIISRCHLNMIIMEFEDRENPLRSREWLGTIGLT